MVVPGILFQVVVFPQKMPLTGLFGGKTIKLFSFGFENFGENPPMSLCRRMSVKLPAKQHLM